MAVKSIQYKQHTIDISYEILNPDAKVDMVVLHGWGSNKALMKKSFSPYLDSFRHIYIDMPGFGNSTCNQVLTTSDYAQILEYFMVHLNVQRDIVVGHSFGGKVATLLNPSVLVLLSSAGIVWPKSLKVKTKIFTFKFLKTLGLSKFRTRFVADDAKELSEPMYETFKNVVDEDFTYYFENYTGKALICWGEEDNATPLKSAHKIQALIKDSKLEIYSGDHYFFMDKAEDISKKIEDTFLSTLEST
jgi:pimeloyl-ACP methyl ester carboxylesterase